jgi:hypothetical protein
VGLFQLVQALALFDDQVFQGFELFIVDRGGLGRREDHGAPGGKYSVKWKSHFHIVNFRW